MDWFRWYRGTCTDPKFTVIARRSKQPRGLVLSIWAVMLETAAEASPRGSLAGWSHEDIGALLDMDGEAVQAVWGAMQAKGLHDGSMVLAWAKRQFEGESSTQRVRDHRNRMKRDETERNAEKPPEEKRDRLEENREEGAPVGASRPRGSRLPDDWELKDGWEESARLSRSSKGLNPDINYKLEAEKFANYWQSMPGSKGVKLNWRKTWINWCLSANARAAPAKPDAAAPPAMLPGTTLSVVMAESYADRIKRNSPVGRGSITPRIAEILIEHNLVTAEQVRAYGIVTRETSEAA